jgi:hypothetical protein
MQIAEAVMRALIRRAYPHHGILGEEFGPENASAEFVWSLSPRPCRNHTLAPRMIRPSESEAGAS